MRAGATWLPLLAAVWAIPAAGAFKCVDEKGRTHIGETPPAACEKVVTYETSRSGAVIRKIEPGGAAAAAPAAKEKEKAAEADKATAEQRRRDKVILDSYASEREIDTLRDRNLEPIKTRLETARGSLQKAQAREQVLQQAADKKGRAVSPDVARDLEAVKAERAAAAAVVARLEKDLEATEARYAADKKRWLELRGAK